MATIVNYSTLVTGVTEYLAREQDTALIARIPTFIQLAEAKMNRSLFVRQMETRSYVNVSVSNIEPQYVSLPSDFQSMRRIRLLNSGNTSLEFLPNAKMDEVRTSRGNATGTPAYFTIFGNEIEICPTPSVNCTLEMVYRTNIPPLGSATASAVNWLILLAPDAYLYGALLESAPYIKEDARLQTWGTGFSSAIDGLNNLGMASTFNAGPLTVRTSSQVF